MSKYTAQFLENWQPSIDQPRQGSPGLLLHFHPILPFAHPQAQPLNKEKSNMRITTDYINFGNILKRHLLNKYPSHKGEFSKMRCCNMGIRFRKEENRFGIYRFDYFAICSLSKCLMHF